ncbi:AbfB domain-containing protein [Roseateles amylovorans]|uniref:Family 16 glycosylhydrolase n=1 Tax=Roseateles amylovorans TaxID=2978473 RepID=A0ABY6AUQ2_9BURK|nr:AbfB domain-containing protein [Roseateles amylovorans]UXH76033.1 family 16 glycosylhydrolase [Roseateles amylovorans]
MTHTMTLPTHGQGHSSSWNHSGNRRSRRWMQSLAAVAFGVASLVGLAEQAQAQTWQLVWQDEFTNGISSNWKFEIGNGQSGWGNNELQYYRRENATVENGNLVITAKREDFGGYRYTSARMITQGLANFRYGKVEARMRLPSRNGLWPAFWMLGSNLGSVGWPASGEIDIMEQINTDPAVYGTVHWQGPDGGHASYGGNVKVDATAYHVYAVEWDPNYIRWFVDGRQFHVVDITNSVNSTEEFQRDFFLLLNMAVGGNWPGFNVDESALPAKMFVDYVRVYKAASATAFNSWVARAPAGLTIRHQASRGRVDQPGSINPAGDGNWKMVTGLAGSGVSFQSQNYPNSYLRQRNGEAWLDQNDGSTQFRQEATFLQAPGLVDGSGVSFQSFTQRDRWLRHRNSLLYVEQINDALARSDATFSSANALTGAATGFSTTLAADGYAQMQGMQLEPSTEGGQNLGWIEANDWVVWNLNLPENGTYTVEYRVASQSGGGTLQLEKAGGSPIYGSLAVPSTGGWQNWTTVSHRVQLNAGQQQIAVKALGSGWNLRYVRVTKS